jgi:hypothetical protein
VHHGHALARSCSLSRGMRPTRARDREGRTPAPGLPCSVVVELAIVARPFGVGGTARRALRSGPHVGPWARQLRAATGRSHGPGVRTSLTWCVVLGCALQVAIGATTVLLEDPIFETSCRAEKSFKFWPVRSRRAF